MKEVTGKRLGSEVSSALCRDGGQGGLGRGDPPHVWGSLSVVEQGETEPRAPLASNRHSP